MFSKKLLWVAFMFMVVEIITGAPQAKPIKPSETSVILPTTTPKLQHTVEAPEEELHLTSNSKDADNKPKFLLSAKVAAENAFKDFKKEITQPLDIGHQKLGNAFVTIKTLEENVVTEATDELEKLLEPLQRSLDKSVDKARRRNEEAYEKCEDKVNKFDNIIDDEIDEIEKCLSLEITRIIGLFEDNAIFFEEQYQLLEEAPALINECTDEECFKELTEELQDHHILKEKIDEETKEIERTLATSVNVLKSCRITNFPGVKEQAAKIVNEFKRCVS